MASTTTRNVAPRGGHPGPSGKSANLWQRTQRARRIAAERARLDARGRRSPVPWKTIASRHDITARQAQRIYSDFCAWEESQHDPLSTVDEAILLRETLLDHLGELAVSADNSSAKVGACRAMLDMDRERLQLMQAVGRLPRNMARYRADVEFSMIVSEVSEVLERAGVGRETIEEIRQVAQRHLAVPLVEGNVTPLPVRTLRPA